MTPQELKAKSAEWNELQVLAYDAEQAGQRAEAVGYRANADLIECELNRVGKDIRTLLCP